ncbi:MAG: hypothetical protein MJ075_04465 [Oscillospiraceae bacterium]|nr:hypothetical protein [Oscillospiraceae bacterium]
MTTICRIISISIGIVFAVCILCGCGPNTYTANNDFVAVPSLYSKDGASGADISNESITVTEDTMDLSAGIDEPAFRRHPEDYTVDLTDYDAFCEGDISGRELLVVLQSSGDTKYPRPEQASKFSPYVIIGTIEEIYFTDKTGSGDSAHILYNFRVEETLRGDFVADDQITIEMYGGYIRGETYDQALKGNGMVSSNEYLEVSLPGNESFPEAGTRCVLFLRKSTTVTGAYSRVGDFTGEYLISSNDTCSRYLAEGKTWVYGSLEDLKAAVCENPFEGEDPIKMAASSFCKE